jgi:hypothetical protein
LEHVAPIELTETTGLERVEDIAAEGNDIVWSFADATNRPLSWLDFGVGVRRLAQIFKA